MNRGAVIRTYLLGLILALGPTVQAIAPAPSGFIATPAGESMVQAWLAWRERLQEPFRTAEGEALEIHLQRIGAAPSPVGGPRRVHGAQPGPSTRVVRSLATYRALDLTRWTPSSQAEFNNAQFFEAWWQAAELLATARPTTQTAPTPSAENLHNLPLATYTGIALAPGSFFDAAAAAENAGLNLVQFAATQGWGRLHVEPSGENCFTLAWQDAQSAREPWGQIEFLLWADFHAQGRARWLARVQTVGTGTWQATHLLILDIASPKEHSTQKPNALARGGLQ